MQGRKYSAGEYVHKYENEGEVEAEVVNVVIPQLLVKDMK